MVGWVLMLGQSQEYCSVRSLKDRGLLFGTGKNNVYRVIFKNTVELKIKSHLTFTLYFSTYILLSLLQTSRSV